MTVAETVIDDLGRELAACTFCTGELPLGPRPLFQISSTARLLIAGQAPGTKAHLCGRTFDDPSGERLRSWLAIDRATFWDARRIAIVPMGLCYPGRLPGGGDKPPRPQCAPLWRARILALMPAIELTLLVGSYAQNAALGAGPVYARVLDYAAYLPRYFPLPHPSWRTGAWEAATPRFGEEIIPALRKRVMDLLR